MISTTKTLLLIAACATGAQAQTVAASDDFDRPDSTNMGADWVEQNGDTVIEGLRGRGNSAFDVGWMNHATFSATYDAVTQQLDVSTSGGGGQSVALVSGLNPNTWGGIYVKLQDNTGDGMFNRLFFESAINAGSWNGGGPVWYELATPTTDARMTLWFDNAGDRAVCSIEDLNGSSLETFSATGILSSAFPPNDTKVGIAHQGTPYFDNWRAWTGPALFGSTKEISLSNGGTQALTINGGTGNENLLYLIAGSASGTAPGFLLDGVSIPLNVDAYTLFTVANANKGPLQNTLGQLDASAVGSASFVIPALTDASLAGTTLHHAAVFFSLSPAAQAATNAVPISFVL